LKIVTRYLLREHIGPLVFAVTTLTSLLLLNYIAKQFQYLVGKGLPWNVIGEFFLLSIPFTVALTFPMAVLISTLYAFSRLAADNEVTAMMACGIGTRRLLAPVLGAGLVLSLVMVWFNDQLLPHANHRLAGLQADISQKKPTLALKPQTLNVVSNTMSMWMSQLDRSRNSMKDVAIYDVARNDVRHTIIADSGALAFATNGHDLLLTLYDGYVLETRHALPNRFQRTFFRSNIVRVANVANELKESGNSEFKSDREKTVCELQADVHRDQQSRGATLARLTRIRDSAAKAFPARYGSRVGEWYCAALGAVAMKLGAVPPPALEPKPAPQRAVRPPTPALERKPGASDPSLIPVQVTTLTLEVDAAQRRISSNDVEIQKKFAISIACLIFALLGPPIALRFPRGGVGLTIGVSFTAFALYYIGLIGGETLSDDGVLPPIVTMWAANALFGVIGLALALGMGRAGASAHGSDFGEVLGRMLPWRWKRSAA
jgi:lipopolysaccharide export system permease protein